MVLCSKELFLLAFTLLIIKSVMAIHKEIPREVNKTPVISSFVKPDFAEKGFGNAPSKLFDDHFIPE